MSATPIPAPWPSLSMATSISRSSVKARQPAGSRHRRRPRCPHRRSHRRRRARRRTRRARLLVPAVDGEDAGDASAIARRDVLSNFVNAPVELVHGRMPPADRDAALEKLRSGEAPVFIATTVIEVGVDVPEATIMVIEHAERFGLAQLPPGLRSRVGRRSKAAAVGLSGPAHRERQGAPRYAAPDHRTASRSPRPISPG